MSIHAVSLLDCPNIINLATAMNMNVRQASIMAAIRSNCCTATGITCDGTNRVTEIDWRDKGLDGIINGTALPPMLTSLEFYLNGLSGTIPKVWPEEMRYIGLGNNNLVGSVPLNWPIGVEFLNLGSNFLTGAITSVVLPPSLVTLYIGDNMLTGDLPTFPASLQHVWLSLDAPTNFNRFSGTLTLTRPVHIIINGNYITDIIVADTTRIISGFCDISNNPLLGNSRISLLTMCRKNNLYSPSMLPNTKITTKSASSRSTLRQSISTIKGVDSSISSTLSISTTTSSRIHPTTIFSYVALRSIPTSVVILKTSSMETFLGVITTDNAPFADHTDLSSNNHQSFYLNTSIDTEISGPTQIDSDNSQFISPSMNLIYYSVGGFVLVCALAVVAGTVFKHPKVHSKYGRKNSLGTLNSVTTVTVQK